MEIESKNDERIWGAHNQKMYSDQTRKLPGHLRHLGNGNLAAAFPQGRSAAITVCSQLPYSKAHTLPKESKSMHCLTFEQESMTLNLSTRCVVLDAHSGLAKWW